MRIVVDRPWPPCSKCGRGVVDGECNSMVWMMWDRDHDGVLICSVVKAQHQRCEEEEG